MTALKYQAILANPNPGLERHWQGLFDEVQVDEDKLSRLLGLPEPERRYVVFFTPRSGSSRLTELLSRTGVMSQPGEAFNPAFVPKMAQAFQARDLATYTNVLMRRRNTSGTFGVEMTYAHLNNTLHGAENMLSLLRPTSYTWLIREDVVAQAISISKMGQTAVSHSVKADDAAQEVAEARFEYDPNQIMYAMASYCLQEDRIEAMMSAHGIVPLRISYEQTVARPEHETVARIARHVGVDLPEMDHPPSSHRKLKGTKAKEFAERFRREHAPFVAEITRRRADRIARLHSPEQS
ncbi:Stf0 family sulfotransferase [Pseudothioclava nitratireducens]|uniref:Stf0 family sulfotransferase n=1 Tax=Pseudothioclava nitratireducens TaxID=1928646 RepID=UPI0023DA2A94|nr:Stf0 family sulfotransferase [Defluviimonas nitratireducens]MDF1619818.1 Stf0 family sulfotransferase [Defluviimonas nitratireducens]